MSPRYGPPHLRESHYIESLARLHLQTDDEERAGIWRQGIATLSAALEDHRRYVPLEGLDPQAVVESLHSANEHGLFDQLDFLGVEAQAGVIYELAAALPPCKLKRELGRRVLLNLRAADGQAFVGIARQIAIGAPKALLSADARARVSLTLDLSFNTNARPEALALALISRRDASATWLTSASTGSLHERRFAARILERAAHAAAFRADAGDESGVRIFQTLEIRDAWERLLSDRESLVWRHIAAGRGLLSKAQPAFAEEIDRHLNPKLGVTEWRRSAASLMASAAVDEEAEARVRELLAGPLFENDRGIAAAMVSTIDHYAQVAPHEAQTLLDDLVRHGGLAAAEALVQQRRIMKTHRFGDWAAKTAIQGLREQLDEETLFDEGIRTLIECVIGELENPKVDRLGALIDDALRLYHSTGPDEARQAASIALSEAHRLVGELEGHTKDQRASSLRSLRLLDRNLIASDALPNLLRLTARGTIAEEALSPIRALVSRVFSWLYKHEGSLESEVETPHAMYRIRRLRSYLRVIDSDIEFDSQHTRQDAVQSLLSRVRHGKSRTLRRAVCATAARAFDSLVREDACEVSDVILVAGQAVQESSDLLTMSEAAMLPDLVESLEAYARLDRTVKSKDRSPGRAARANLDELSRLARGLPIATSARVEALRHALMDLARALDPLAASASMEELMERTDGDSPLRPLEMAAQNLARLSAGASRRLGEASVDRPESGNALRLVGIHFERAIRGNREGLKQSIDDALETVSQEIPQALSGVIASTLSAACELPDRSEAVGRPSFMPSRPVEVVLPSWVPRSRLIGGFYLVRPIGTGAVGSVFVARCSEARHDKAAEQFALKVPEYTGGAARLLSEEEFLEMFGTEAGALISLPSHRNLARFVTFDLGAKPKPALVMELVEGPNLARVIDTGDLDMGRALDLLEGIASGLFAMHETGIAHLDIKPSNIIVRDTFGGDTSRNGDPVLVDFGLAGRTLRPGCGTANYGAPEVWGQDVSGDGKPLPVDVYAFGCLSFELITGQTLFEQNSDIATIAAHLKHDGMPQRLASLMEDPRTRGLGEFVRRSIRRDPRDRVTMKQLLGAIHNLRQDVKRLGWPLQVVSE